MSRFGPHDATTCHLCADTCTLASVGNDLCAEWLHATSNKYNSEMVWHFAEYKPGHFVLFNYKRETVLLTRDWNEVLEFYRNRPAYVPPVSRTISAPKTEGLGGLKLEIKL